MAVYRVHILPGAPDPVAGAEGAKFLREGFSWSAFLFGPLWLLAHGLWRPLLVWCVGALIAGLVVSYGFLPAAAEVWLYLLSALFIGLEGRGFAAAAAERGGFCLVDIAVGDDRLAAERSFFSRWLVDPEPAPLGPRPNTPFAPPHVIGLFPESGG
jgi:hypothetical protein